MGFSNPDFKKIYEFSGKEYIETEFSGYDIKLNYPVFDTPWDLVITVDKSKFECLFQKRDKKQKLSEEEKEKLIKERENLRQELAELSEKTATKFAYFRVKLYSSVLNKMLLDIKDKKKPEKFSFHLNEKNILHVLPSHDRIELIYGINFIHNTDISLAKVFLQELEEAKRHVRNCLDAKVYVETDKIPKDITDIDQPRNYSNGLVVFNLYIKDYNMVSQKLNYFVNFRQYIQFHIHSIKTFLHIRMNKKGRDIEAKLGSCQIIPNEYIKQLEQQKFYASQEKKEEKDQKFLAESIKLKNKKGY